MLFRREKVAQFPEEVSVESVVPADEEILEEWIRNLHKAHSQFHSVNAIRVDDQNFPWYVYFGAGEFIREEPFVNDLNESIVKALLNVERVTQAFHEDTEKYVISGNPSGEDLVRQVSEAIDQFIKSNLENWENAVRK